MKMKKIKEAEFRILRLEEIDRLMATYKEWESKEDGKVYPMEYHGSAHIHALSGAHGIIAMEIGKKEIKKGELVHVRQI